MEPMICLNWNIYQHIILENNPSFDSIQDENFYV